MNQRPLLSHPTVLGVALSACTAMGMTACSDDSEGGGGPGGQGAAAGAAGLAGAPAAEGGVSGAAGAPAAEGGEGGMSGVAGAPAAEGGVSGVAGAPAVEGGQGGVSGVAGAPAEGGEGGVDEGMAGAGGMDRDVHRPELVPFTAARFESLQVAEGFTIEVYAQDLQDARMLATHGGHVYLTRPTQGDVLRFVDDDSDGIADSTIAVASDLPTVHGIAFHEGVVYLATPQALYRGSVDEEGDFQGVEPTLEDLPDGGQHPLRTLGVGPDQMLYISVGSSCDACPETNPEHATMLRAPLDGESREIFAEGLRNTIGFDWHPDTGKLWGMDHGSDWRGDDLPPEELNLLEMGNNYGWPYCFGKQQVDPIIDDPPGTTKEAHCEDTTPSVHEYQAHGAPIGMVFYDGEGFPAEYTGDAFIALHGSWNRYPPTGYKVVRLGFEGGEPTEFEDFVTGFLSADGETQFGRPAGIVVAPDGALLFTDDDNGMVYRVAAEQD